MTYRDILPGLQVFLLQIYKRPFLQYDLSGRDSVITCHDFGRRRKGKASRKKEKNGSKQNIKAEGKKAEKRHR
jgi:hypothetical protein